MALEKYTTIDKVEVSHLPAGYPVIGVRAATVVTEDGVELSRVFHRRVIMPDADLSGEDASVVKIAEAVFTDAAKAAYAAQEG